MSEMQINVLGAKAGARKVRIKTLEVIDATVGICTTQRHTSHSLQESLVQENRRKKPRHLLMSPRNAGGKGSFVRCLEHPVLWMERCREAPWRLCF